MTVKAIIDKVRAAIDELMVNDAAFLNETDDEQNLNTVITESIPHALLWLLEHAPAEKLDEAGITGTGAYTSFSIGSDLTAQAKLSDGVLRVVSARLSSWKQSPQPVTEQSEVYLMQSDPYARGSWDRPVSAIVHRSGAGGAERWIELYGAKTQQDTLHMLVYKKPDLSKIAQTGVSVPVVLESALIYQVAGLVMTAFREEAANRFFALASQYAGIEQPEVTNS